MKTKKLYQAPLTERNVVELEGEFCGSITTDAGKGVGVTSTPQAYEEYDAFNDEAFIRDDANTGIKWE